MQYQLTICVFIMTEHYFYSLFIMDDQFDVIAGLGEKIGYQSDSSIKDAFAYLSNVTLQKAHVFLTPDHPLLVLITKMNGIIVVIGLLP